MEKNIRGILGGEILKPGKDSQVWATYTQEFYEGKPAVTTRKLGKGTVTYVGVDSTDGLLEKDILKKLYAQLNIPVMDLPYGVTLEYRNGMGIVLNYTDKPYNFVLPSGSQSADRRAGNSYSRSIGIFYY